MKTRSESKVKDAPGFSSAILFLCLLANTTFGQLSSQQFSGKRITIACENMPLVNVLDQLTRQSGVRFVYSSSTIEVGKPITLQVTRYQFDKVLEAISGQVDVAFKRQGNYIVIKKNVGFAAPVRNNVSTMEIVSTPGADVVNANEADDDQIPLSRLREYPVYAGITGNENSSNDFFRSGPGLLGWDTAFVIKNLPVLLSNKTVYQYHKRWFVSGGLFVNDYSGGLEVQAGIPALYAVVSGSFIKPGLFRLGYGLGTSIPLKPAVSANLSYTFSALKSVSYDAHSNPYKATAQHHQAKVMANINLSGHFSLRVGPTLNFMNSYFSPEDRPYTVSIVRAREARPSTYMPFPRTGYTEVVYVSAPAPVKEYHAAKSWIGFEAGITYRVNFSIRK